MVQDFWLEGSGAKYKPYFSTARERSRFTTPGSTTARRFSGSISKMWFMREKEMTMPPRRAKAPPESPVPAPRPTMGRLVAIGQGHNRDDVFFAGRENDGIGMRLLDGAVVFIEKQILGVGQDSRGAEEGFQFTDDGSMHRCKSTCRHYGGRRLPARPSSERRGLASLTLGNAMRF